MKFDLKDVSVMVAVPVNRDFPWQTTLSLVDTVGALAARGIPYTVRLLTQGSQIDHDRSQLAYQFLQSDFNRLFWIDSDMSWKADEFLKVLALSTVMPVVGASYPAKKEPVREFHLELTGDTLEANEYGCFPVLGMGLGFTCVQREVMVRLAEKSRLFVQNGEYIPMIFRTGIDDEGVYRSEDMHFFKDCRRMGYTVWCDPNVELGHIGGKEFRGKMINALAKSE